MIRPTLYLILILSILSPCLSQLLEIPDSFPQLKMSKDGLTDFVVVEVGGKSQSEIFDWIIDYFETTLAYTGTSEPLYKITYGSVSEKIIFSSSVSGFTNFDIYVKDGKYKFDPVGFFISGTDINLHEDSYSKWYKSDGTIKPKDKSNADLIESIFNGFNYGIFQYLTSKKEPSDDW